MGHFRPGEASYAGRRLLCGALLAVCLASSAPALFAVCPYFVRFTPVILLDDGLSSTRLEVFAGRNATEVTLRVSPNKPLIFQGASACRNNPLEVRLYDDGTHGDVRAGDGVFSIDDIRYDAAAPPSCRAQVFTPIQMMSGLKEILPLEISISTPAGPVTPGNRFSLFLADSNWFRTNDEIVQLAPDIQAGPYAINVLDNEFTVENGLFQLTGPGQPQFLTNKLYRVLPDSYDFLTVISTTQAPCISGIAGGTHLWTKIDWSGTGQNPLNITTTYGSAGRLIGINFIEAQSFYGVALHHHETMHQWAAYLNDSLGLSQGAHWNGNTSVGGAVGACAWKDNEDGTFTSLGFMSDSRRFPDLELYLMGLIPTAEVKPLYISSTLNQPFCAPGTRIVGPFQQVTINDIVRIHGVRSPGPNASQKNSRVAMVVTSQNRLLTPLEMTLYNQVGQLIEGSRLELGPNPPLKFAELTGNRATLSTRLDFLAGPRIQGIGVLNAASSLAERVASGEIITIYGSEMGPAVLAYLRLNPSGLVDTTLANVRVLFDGIPAPLIYVQANQLSAIVPYGIAGRTATSLQVEYQGKRSNVASLAVAEAAPGIFTQNLTGKGPGAILNEDYSLNTASNPASRGSAIQIYATGEGRTNPSGVDGKIAAGELPKPLLPVAVKIGEVEAQVEYAGAAPGAVAGLLQVNARVPEGVSPGSSVAVALTVGTAKNQPGVTVAVK